MGILGRCIGHRWPPGFIAGYIMSNGWHVKLVPASRKGFFPSGKATLIGGKGNLSLGFDEHSKGVVVDGRDFHHGAEATFFDVNISRAKLVNYFVDNWFGSRPW